MDARERFLGCLLGLATGDALGTAFEFKEPGDFTPIRSMVGGGPFHLEPGQYTDDTSLALCLAESLVERRGFDPVDQLERYCRWWKEGYLSSTGRCFDIGTTTRAALSQFQRTREPYPGQTDSRSASNGSLMRLAPVAMFFSRDPERAIEMAGESSRTTHGLPVVVDACRYFAGLIVGALEGRSKDEILSPHFCPVEGFWDSHPLCEEVREVARGSFKEKEPPEIRGRGYVVASMEAALWAFSNGRSFEEGCLLSVNLGEDADTTGAIYGQLAGAFYGVGAIPRKWLSVLAFRELIEEYAEKLFILSQEVA
ncbi:MAG: ADP-ribosylglycohydrolase family protein [Methanolinea sp.]|nr:ADP-ribosylglycohydrolase family protein [Methanolinea sp.]